MLPPRSADAAAAIAGDVAARVRVAFAEPAFEELRVELAAQVKAGDHWHPLIEAERLATEAIRDRWSAVSDGCERALEEVHELYLVRASYVRESVDDLGRLGVESWIAKAVSHLLAFDLAWDVLDDLDLLTELPEG